MLIHCSEQSRQFRLVQLSSSFLLSQRSWMCQPEICPSGECRAAAGLAVARSLSNRPKVASRPNPNPKICAADEKKGCWKIFASAQQPRRGKNVMYLFCLWPDSIKIFQGNLSYCKIIRMLIFAVTSYVTIFNHLERIAKLRWNFFWSVVTLSAAKTK